jgi:hypothetical protein
VGGLHSMTDEHFGISVVEYMAAGGLLGGGAGQARQRRRRQRWEGRQRRRRHGLRSAAANAALRAPALPTSLPPPRRALINPSPLPGPLPTRPPPASQASSP